MPFFKQNIKIQQNQINKKLSLFFCSFLLFTTIFGAIFLVIIYNNLISEIKNNTKNLAFLIKYEIANNYNNSADLNFEFAKEQKNCFVIINQNHDLIKKSENVIFDKILFNTTNQNFKINNCIFNYKTSISHDFTIFVGYDIKNIFEIFKNQIFFFLFLLIIEILIFVKLFFDLKRQILQKVLDEKNKSKKSEAEKNLFLSNINHQLRTPLNAILGISQNLSESEKIDKENLKNIKIIENSAKEISALLNGKKIKNDSHKNFSTLNNIWSSLENKGYKRILICEDNEISAKILTKILQKMNIEVDHVVNGRGAIKNFLNVKYDLIFMDCMMPELDGYQATTEIRKIEKINKMKKVPIIALTANTTENDFKKCLKSGMDDIITKPITQEIIAKKIEIYC